jgi:LysM repeat protein
LDNGELIPSSPQVFSQYPGQSAVLDPATCFAIGEQDVKMTQFIRTESRDIYVVVNGEKFALKNFSDYESLSEDSLGYNWVTNWFASTIPNGTELPSETTIVTEDGATVGDFISDEEQDQQVPPSEPTTSDPEPTPDRSYTVKAGDFLSKIAASQGSTVAAIVEANNLANPNLIRVGQVLTIPGNNSGQTDSDESSEPEPEPSPEPEPEPSPEPEVETETGSIEYRVKSGDFLSQIATRFGVSSAEIAKASNLANPNLIFVGQVLTIPNQQDEIENDPQSDEDSHSQSDSSSETYRIKAGDTLFRIAARFGVSYRAIVEENNISNPNLIRVGQVIRIP